MYIRNDKKTHKRCWYTFIHCMIVLKEYIKHDLKTGKNFEIGSDLSKLYII